MDKVEFGAVVPRYGVEYERVKALARECELLGYGSVWLTDHLQPLNVSEPVMETWTTLTALAHEVRMRIGVMALYYAYRHPAVLRLQASRCISSDGRHPGSDQRWKT